MLKRYFTCAILFVSILPFTGCLQDKETDLEKRQREEKAMITSYLETNNIDADEGNYGIFYKALSESNSGVSPKTDDHVLISYTMKTLDGDLIDSTTAANPTVMFRHSLYAEYNIFPKGLDVAVNAMEVGDRYLFFIPSYLAFEGYSYQSTLPANSILMIEMTLEDIVSDAEILRMQKETIEQYISEKQYTNVVRDTSGVFYVSTNAGTEGVAPEKNDLVSVDYVGTILNGKEFDRSTADNPLKFTIGAESVIPGFETGITQMHKGESGIIIIPSGLAYGSDLQIIPIKLRDDYLKVRKLREIPAYSILVFEVTLKEVQ